MASLAFAATILALIASFLCSGALANAFFNAMIFFATASYFFKAAFFSGLLAAASLALILEILEEMVL